MKATLLAILSSSILAVRAGVEPTFVRQEVDWSLHAFAPPGPDDVRSPCPGLNTLANHGFFNRTGRDISPEELLQGAFDAYNIDPKLLNIAAKIGMVTSGSFSTLSLEGLRFHNTIEHDASLSRDDFASGDNHSFNEEIYDATLAASNPDVDYYDAVSAGKVLDERLDLATARNPDIINTSKEFKLRATESALYLAVMGNVNEGKAPKEFVDIFFREERLPLEEGWTSPEIFMEASNFGLLVQSVAAASQWPGPNEGQDPSVAFVTSANSSFVI